MRDEVDRYMFALPGISRHFKTIGSSEVYALKMVRMVRAKTVMVDQVMIST